MEKYNLKDMKFGWFVGQFSPSVFKTETCEVGYKQYKKGEKDSKKYYHKKATEITLIVSGKIKLNETIYRKDDIVVISPNEAVSFECLTNVNTIVIKLPGTLNDKFYEEL